MRLHLFRVSISIVYFSSVLAFRFSNPSCFNNRFGSKCFSPAPIFMAMDDFFLQKLDSMQRTFNAVTERLADPDIANDRCREFERYCSVQKKYDI